MSDEPTLEPEPASVEPEADESPFETPPLDWLKESLDEDVWERP
jgi:hypothetical protein